MAYHFHWARAEVMGLDHLERQRWVHEIGKINQRINRADADDFE